MTLIDQLERTVTTAVLGNDDNVAHTSLLEQFYAILITRLAQPMAYSQLLRSDHSVAVPSTENTNVFEQIWQSIDQRQLLIDELAVTHHVDAVATEQLLINAAQLAYQELKNQAQGQFLPAFLQAEQPAVRQYLPVWADEVLSLIAVTDEKVHSIDNSSVGTSTINTLNSHAASDNSPNDNVISDNASNANVPSSNAKRYDATKDDNGTATDMTDLASPSLITATADVPVNSSEGASEQMPTQVELSEAQKNSIDAIHVNPSDYRASHTATGSADVSNRKRRNAIVIGLLLVGALVAIGLVWALVIQPNSTTPAEPVATAPVITAPIEAPIAQVLTPAELVVAVDNSGSLYNCTAIIGDDALQGALRQGLNVSFGEQTSSCELTVKEGVATSLSGINTETLPDIFTLLRSVPFARLQLQNDTLNLEAPDAVLLQNLVTDMRTLIPAIAITTSAPLPLSDNNAMTADEANDMAAMNGVDDEYNEGVSVNEGYGGDVNNTQMSSAQNYQALDDDTNDSVVPAPPNSNSSFNNNFNNNRATATRAGTMSAAEVDELANTTIVAEQLRNERPVDKNVTQDR